MHSRSNQHNRINKEPWINAMRLDRVSTTEQSHISTHTYTQIVPNKAKVKSINCHRRARDYETIKTLIPPDIYKQYTRIVLEMMLMTMIILREVWTFFSMRGVFQTMMRTRGSFILYLLLMIFNL